ncbi:cysteine synthase family protein [candidate division KSB1 bacterium]|nr:cysteine synthase family protein [candidate division KSB1 bacterium]
MNSIIENRFLKKASEDSIAHSRKQIIEQVGNTPLIELSSISKEVKPVQIFAKAEWFNPGGSVKDRAALNMILQGEKSRALTKDKIILDATSGNTGIAYAMIGAALGYKVKLAIPQNAGNLFKQTLAAYGAELIYSNPQHGSDGAIREAIRLYEKAPEQYFYPDQYNNSANWLAHYDGTGAEIIRQTKGKITHFIAGLGTSGTFMGAGRRLKEFNEDIQLISVQPDSPLHGLEGLKHMKSAILPGIYDTELADDNLEISTEESQLLVKRLAKEGLLVGMSAGAALAAALIIAKRLTTGVIVVIFPDSAHKYFDQRFWQEN